MDCTSTCKTRGNKRTGGAGLEEGSRRLVREAETATLELGWHEAEMKNWGTEGEVKSAPGVKTGGQVPWIRTPGWWTS